MNLSSLRYAPGSKKKRKRLGRGDASGYGGTSGRGHKGYKARSGSKRRAWFEGGQMPIYRRLPKKGFTNIFKEEYQIVNLDLISEFQLDEVDTDILYEKGIIKSLSKPIKILGRGEIKEPITVTVDAISKSAREKIESAGGKVNII
jgi:large subunit ribosomal protein L15